MIDNDTCPQCKRTTGCRCTPSISIARRHHVNEHCEACKLPIVEFEAIHEWGDDVISHVECPRKARA